jgi:hypothetical protein
MPEKKKEEERKNNTHSSILTDRPGNPTSDNDNLKTANTGVGVIRSWPEHFVQPLNGDILQFPELPICTNGQQT